MESARMDGLIQRDGVRVNEVRLHVQENSLIAAPTPNHGDRADEAATQVRTALDHRCTFVGLPSELRMLRTDSAVAASWHGRSANKVFPCRNSKCSNNLKET